MEPEDFEDYIREREREEDEKERKEMIKVFSQACEEGYTLIEDHGSECIPSKEGKKEAQRALNRMLGHFIQMEEYEKCSKIKSVYLEVFQKDPKPELPNF